MQGFLLFLLVLIAPILANTECDCQWQPPKIGDGGYLSRHGFSSTKVQANAIRIFLMQQKIKELQEMTRRTTDNAAKAIYAFKDVAFRTDRLEESSTYIGCYQDNPGRLMKGLMTQDHKVNFGHDNSITKCSDHCAKRGFPYAGMQSSKECFCSKFLPNDVNKVAKRLCNLPCPGSVRGKCGGDWKLSIYKSAVTGCKKNEFKCLDDSGCVKNFLVCDRVEDCDDGSDEDPTRCASIYAQLGSEWNATIIWTGCRSQPSQKVYLVVTKIERSHTMPSSYYWLADVTLDGEEPYVIRGDWDFSKQRVHCYPVDYTKAEVGFICEGTANIIANTCRVFVGSPYNDCGHTVFFWTSYEKGREKVDPFKAEPSQN